MENLTAKELMTKQTQKETLNLSRFHAHKEKRASMIVAQVIISESELVKVLPNYSADMEEKDTSNFADILWQLGLDTNKPYQRQDGIKHRNRLNEVVLCSRWIGDERQDEAWIKSGYASKAAIDKYSGSKILEDLYRERSATVDTQEYLESRDKYAVIDESVWMD